MNWVASRLVRILLAISSLISLRTDYTQFPIRKVSSPKCSKILKSQLAIQFPIWQVSIQKFSKVSIIVISFSQWSSEPTRENFPGHFVPHLFANRLYVHAWLRHLSIWKCTHFLNTALIYTFPNTFLNILIYAHEWLYLLSIFSKNWWLLIIYSSFQKIPAKRHFFFSCQRQGWFDKRALVAWKSFATRYAYVYVLAIRGAYV